MADKKYDVGILGYWYATNYGSAITYYALYKAIEKNKQVPVLIDRPEKEKDAEGLDVFPRRFLNSHCNISESVKWEDLEKLNNICETFVIGSDQVWTRDAIRITRYMFFLNFVNNNKREIAYAPSFGQDRFEVTPEEHALVSKYLSKFDAISVREQSGKDILKNQFGIEAQHILDPVFLIDIKDYDKLAEESKVDTSEDFALAYILDPTPDKEEFIRKSAEKLGLKVKIILDGRKGTYDRNRAKFAYFNDEHILPNMEVVDWVKYFKDAKYVLTDSHHGMAMAIIYNKQFIVYANRGRGYTRFTSLLNLLGITDRMIDNTNQADDSLIFSDIDYNKVMSKLNQEREAAHQWLSEALKCKIKDKSKILFKAYNGVERPLSQVKILPSYPEFKKARLLATLLRDYGLKHVVISSGTRHVDLVRIFEANSCFKTYPVVDERSAGFFAIGIAQMVKEPVILCCTSGTSTANYLSAVAEAFYQNVPLIVITADRFPCFLGQEEDQTICQNNIYGNMVKKSVTIPVSDGALSEWQTRRMISDAILEATHHGMGPVHINFPILTINRKKPDESVLKLGTPIRQIRRIVAGQDEWKWKDRIEFLKTRVKKILLIYGQNHDFMDDYDLTLFEKFCEKFKCVVVKDHLGNCNYNKAFQSTPIVNLVSQEFFDQELCPDLVITFGGRLMSVNPLVNLLRASKKNYYHWRIAEDGEVRDKYKRLSCVFECTKNYFMKNLLEKAVAYNGDDNYYNSWLNASLKFKQKTFTNYSEQFAIERVVKSIPQDSILHLALSNISRFANRFPIKAGIRSFCNLGTNGIDGSTSTFMGCAAVTDKLCFLLVGDLSFFYDMNSLWNKRLKSNIRIVLFNNGQAGLLADHESPAITYSHNTTAKGWVESLGFNYFSVRNAEELSSILPAFVEKNSNKPIFLEVFC